MSLSAIFPQTGKSLSPKKPFVFNLVALQKLWIQVHSNLSVGSPVFLSLLLVAELIPMLKCDPESVEFSVLSTGYLQFAVTIQTIQV